MNSLQELLEDGDPLVEEPMLDEAEARVMRRTVVAAAEEAGGRRLVWRYAAAMAVMAAVLIGAISTVARREPPVADGSQTLAELPPVEMQFSTPGGTRVIWVFDQSGAE
jgi:hypothetical protein